MIKFVTVVILSALAVLTSGDEDPHHFIGDEFCPLPKDQQQKILDCITAKLPESVLYTWTRCAETVYGTDILGSFEQKCTGGNEAKHEQMDECSEPIKEEFTEVDMLNILADCSPSD